jgi:hypothetical protein
MRIRGCILLFAACAAIASCGEGGGGAAAAGTDRDGDSDTGADADADSDADSDTDSGPSPISFVSVAGDHGDIAFVVRLELPEAEARDLEVDYRGACTPDAWTPALVEGETVELGGGDHALVWHSWDQEAGCSGEVVLRATTDQAEAAESEPFALANAGEQSGFAVFPQWDQGVNEDEVGWFDAVLAALLPEESVDFVATRRGDLYEVHAARGAIEFTREQTNTGYAFDVTILDGVDPIASGDPAAAPTLSEELALGGNPNGATFAEAGYDGADPRLSFIEREDDVYPFGYARLAAYFDHPDAADAVVNWTGYAHFEEAPGEHGSLNLWQSRSPLVAWGAGIEPGAVEEPVRIVDIAPTVAKLLGFPEIDGVDERGIRSAYNLLGWQDGRSLDAMLDGEIAERVVVLALDGLTHSELMSRLDWDAAHLPNLARLREEGAHAAWGSISNYPSVTYPSHNVIGSGLWSGHHGLVANSYYLRAEAAVASPIEETFNTGGYWNPILAEGETLHEAVHRVFGDWGEGDLGGAYTASVFDPSVVGANTADLEFVDDSGQIAFPLSSLDPAPGVAGPNVPIWEIDVWGEQLSESLAMNELHLLFTNGVSPAPTYVIMNFPTTDGCGHAKGPHGDLMDEVLRHVDANVGLILGWLEEWGLAETTAILLTSDHGMQLGDPTRYGHPLDALDAAGVPYVAGTGLGLYAP